MSEGEIGGIRCKNLSHKVMPEQDCGNSGHVRSYTRRARGAHTNEGKSYGVWKEEKKQG